MRRRFGRGRRGGRSAGEGRAPIDAARACEQMVEAGIAGARALAPVADDEVPGSLVAVGVGETAEGRALVVAFSPQHGGDAALAALAHGLRLREEGGFDGEVVAVAPQWHVAARRRLALLGQAPFSFRAVAATGLSESVATVEVERADEAVLLPRQIAASAGSASARALFRRTLAALDGLAAKHGGAVRGASGGAELVLLARRVAALRADGDAVLLETFGADRGTTRLSSDQLSAAMDRLEGALRKRLSDRRSRSGEEALRASLIPVIATAAELRAWLPWPLAGSDPDVLDLAGVARNGAPVVAAARAQLGLGALGSVLDALAALRPSLALLFAEDEAGVLAGQLRLFLAAREFDAAALRVLPFLSVQAVAYDVEERAQGPALARREESEHRSTPSAPARPEAPRRAPPRPERLREPRPVAGREPEAKEPLETSETREAPSAGAPREGAAPERSTSYEEISLFDLGDMDDASDSQTAGETGRRRRRGRGRRRRRGRATAGGASGDSDGDEDERAPEVEAARSPRRDRRPRRAAPAREGVRGGERDLLAAAEDADDEDETFVPLAEDAPEIEAVEEETYDDEDELGEEESSEDARLRQEREARRRARLAKSGPDPEGAPAPRPPRRRAAIVAHADRDSVFAAIILARDVRLLEGFWVYPQSELMTFFRSVATDLREGTPIYVVGFAASPVRETLQAAALYQGRLDWFDAHEWPPEDLGALREAIGVERVHVADGAGSALPAVLSERTRRSRFSDKLVDLVTGRFTQHDYERWGRLWWARVEAAARNPGERRSDVDALLTGRPSELAREAARADVPPPPPEVAYVSSHDFRLVHFGGYSLVVVPVPPDLDLHLAARVARERYAAQVSVAHRPEAELLVLGGDEGRGRRGLDLGAMAEHLASKHPFVDVLSDEDHVARVRVRGLASYPERLDDVLSEIAMGRSILEG